MNLRTNKVFFLADKIGNPNKKFKTEVDKEIPLNFWTKQIVKKTKLINTLEKNPFCGRGSLGQHKKIDYQNKTKINNKKCKQENFFYFCIKFHHIYQTVEWNWYWIPKTKSKLLKLTLRAIGHTEKFLETSLLEKVKDNQESQT